MIKMAVDMEGSETGIQDYRLGKDQGALPHTNPPTIPNSVLDTTGKIASVDLKCRERVTDSDVEEHDQSGNKLALNAINVSFLKMHKTYTKLH